MSEKASGRVAREDIFDVDGALTATFLLSRGYCCGNGCRNCPYEPRHGGPSARTRRVTEEAPGEIDS